MMLRSNVLSLCMIVKNEQAHLHRCLSSIKPVVDELIIVDTGSTDRTKAIARDFGARIFDFNWQNDFAAARNFGLARATGHWILVLDADEIISARDHKPLRTLASHPSIPYTAYSFVTRNYLSDAHQVGWTSNRGDYPLEEAGSGWIPTEKVRLFPRDPEIVFSYPVHEVLEPALVRKKIPIQPCPIPVHHYGPLNESRLKAKNRQYYRIGKTKLADAKNNGAALHELALQAGNLGKIDEAIELWRQAIALQPDQAESYVHLSTAFFRKAEYEQSKRTALTALELAPGMKEAIYNRALCEVCSGEFAAAGHRLAKLLQSHPQYLPARFLLAVICCCTLDSDAGPQALAELLPTAMGSNLAATLQDLVQRLTKMGWKSEVSRILEAAIKAGIKI